MPAHDLVFLASVASKEQWHRPGANIPMAKWAAGLIEGLRGNGAEPVVLGHQYERSWPFGQLFPGRQGGLDPNYVDQTVPFSNLPLIRNFELKHAYARAIRRLGFEQPGACILTYNPLPWHVYAARKFQQNGGIWVNIVLDFDEKDLGEEWRDFNTLCGAADGQVFLSWWAYEQSPSPQKLFLDSGVSSVHFEPDQLMPVKGKNKRVVYAGKIGGYGGSELMAKTFRSVKGEDVEFLICGRGQCDALSHAASVDSRIKLIGFVDDYELDELCRTASVFFNPRDPHYSNNRMIFPSKLLQYLAYGKPVVSTYTDGISPEYNSVLQIPPSNGAEELAVELRKTLDLSDQELLELMGRQYTFVTQQRSWQCQAERLLAFIKSISSGK